jgi:hypothetical protein
MVIGLEHCDTIPFQVFVNFSLVNDFLHNQSCWCPQILPVDAESTWLLEYFFIFFLRKYTRRRSFSDGGMSKISGDCKKCHGSHIKMTAKMIIIISFSRHAESHSVTLSVQKCTVFQFLLCYFIVTLL